MFLVKKNPILPEILVSNEAGDIVCRLPFNDFAQFDEPESAAMQFANVVAVALTRSYGTDWLESIKQRNNNSVLTELGL